MILLAVSGGIDSMYLANRAGELFPGEEFAVAHCNFCLRGNESDGDEAFVREWCESKGIECLVKHFDTSAYASAKGISIEMAARELRYAWFNELCSSKGFRAVAVAHNANDNAETLVLNLLRGTGLRGIRGMAAESELGGLTVIRPLLNTPRAEILQWMNSKGLKWREDRTNSDSQYKRNRIRNEVFPLFETINPAYLRTLCQNMERFAQADDIAEDYVSEALRRICDGEGRYSIPTLLEYRHWKYILWRIVESSGISGPTFQKLVELLQRYADAPAGTVTLGGKTFETPSTSIRIIRKKLIVG